MKNKTERSAERLAQLERVIGSREKLEIKLLEQAVDTSTKLEEGAISVDQLLAYAAWQEKYQQKDLATKVGAHIALLKSRARVLRDSIAVSKVETKRSESVVTQGGDVTFAKVGKLIQLAKSGVISNEVAKAKIQELLSSIPGYTDVVSQQAKPQTEVASVLPTKRTYIRSREKPSEVVEFFSNEGASMSYKDLHQKLYGASVDFDVQALHAFIYQVNQKLRSAGLKVTGSRSKHEYRTIRLSDTGEKKQTETVVVGGDLTNVDIAVLAGALEVHYETLASLKCMEKSDLSYLRSLVPQKLDKETVIENRVAALAHLNSTLESPEKMSDFENPTDEIGLFTEEMLSVLKDLYAKGLSVKITRSLKELQGNKMRLQEEIVSGKGFIEWLLLEAQVEGGARFEIVAKEALEPAPTEAEAEAAVAAPVEEPAVTDEAPIEIPVEKAVVESVENSTIKKESTKSKILAYSEIRIPEFAQEIKGESIHHIKVFTDYGVHSNTTRQYSQLVGSIKMLTRFELATIMFLEANPAYKVYAKDVFKLARKISK